MAASRRGARVAASVLVPLGALIAGASFFLPYLRLLRMFGASLTLSGPRIGGGLWLVPAVAAAILLAQLGLRRRRGLRRVLVVCGALFGLLLAFAVVARLHHRTGLLFVHFSAATFGVRPAIGWVGTLVGFLVVLLAALL